MSAILGTSVTGAGGPAAYTIDNSLRFRSSASADLSRTPSSIGNRKTWTWSGWVKRGSLGSLQVLFGAGTSSGTPPYETALLFLNTDQLAIVINGNAGIGGQASTSAVFRDPSAWYHIVAYVDMSASGQANKARLYVNGVLQSVSYANLGTTDDTQVNNNVIHTIARYSYTTAGYFDGYVAEVNFIDGQALTPSSFGETNSSTGVWQPKAYTGSYGTNGFYLKFSNIATTSGSNTGLGRDFSGNGNFWNTNNISVTAGSTYDAMTDSPTLKSNTIGNYPVFNPVNNLPTNNSAGTVISSGNLQLFSNGAEGFVNGTAIGTMQIPSTGKWYWEVTITNRATAAPSRSQVGIIAQAAYYAASLDVVYATVAGVYAYTGNGQKAASPNGIFTNYGSSWSNGDVVGVACDFDAGTISFYLNNVNQGVAFSGLSGSSGYYPIVGYWGTFNINFGQRPFAYTPPSGFNRLQTFNLPTPTIGASATTQANDYFDISLYSGNNSTQTVTNSGAMQPDMVWIKSRNVNGANHVVTDSVRGVNRFVITNLSDSEFNVANTLTSFNSNGFSLGNSVYDFNISGNNYVAWQWRANQGTNVTNTAGSITSTVSANTTAGFSVVTWTGAGSTGTIGHGLGATPNFIILKRRNAAVNWFVGGSNIASAGNGTWSSVIEGLNTTNGVNTGATAIFNSTAPTSTVFTGGSEMTINGATYVAYCFTQVRGYSAFGLYTGNGSTDGPFVYLGFRPRFVMFKRTDASNSWYMYDTSRTTINVMGAELAADSSGAESTFNSRDFLSNGFKLRSANASLNASGGTYIYMAFAESPFNYSLAR